MPITATDNTTTTPPTTGSSITDHYLKTIRRERADSIIREDGVAYLGQYQIPADQWETWAAAAGLPNARWNDPSAATRVAGWAAMTLYEEFGNWGLVAIGWKFGPAAAREFQQRFGDSLSGELIKNLMGEYGANFYNDVMNGMATVIAASRQPDMGAPSPGNPGGEVSLEFVPETADEAELPVPRSADPAHTALMSVLSGMADRVAGGRRLSVEDAEVQSLEDVETTVSPVTAEDTEHLEGD